MSIYTFYFISQIKELILKTDFIGAGVAGLTAALSCAYHGMTVSLYEKNENVESPIGAGVGLNGGLLALTKMGYRDMYKDIMEPLTVHHNVKGDKIIEVPMNFKGTPLEDHIGIFRRSDLIRNYIKEVNKNPKIKVYIGKKVTKYTQDRITVYES